MKAGTLVFWWSYNRIEHGSPHQGVVISTNEEPGITQHSASGMIVEIGSGAHHSMVKYGGDDEKHWFTLSPGRKYYGDRVFVAPKDAWDKDPDK